VLSRKPEAASTARLLRSGIVDELHLTAVAVNGRGLGTSTTRRHSPHPAAPDSTAAAGRARSHDDGIVSLHYEIEHTACRSRFVLLRHQSPRMDGRADSE